MQAPDLSQLSLLLEQDVQVPNTEGNTPLHYACLSGHAGLARLLLQQGASPSTLNK